MEEEEEEEEEDHRQVLGGGAAAAVERSGWVITNQRARSVPVAETRIVMQCMTRQIVSTDKHRDMLTMTIGITT